jgi:uncharacterized coiled-coil DUF342 family protein
MTQKEQIKIQEISTTQAVMKEHQKNMQNDINELKQKAKDINTKLDNQDAKIDELIATMNQITGGRKLLIWLAATATTIAGLLIAYLNGHQK